MPRRDEINSAAREWIQKADNDLTTAVHTLTLGTGAPTDTVCFHAQQRVEKSLKAILTANRLDFPKTHSIPDLLAMVPPRARPKMTPVEQERLTDYATAARYPGYEPIPLAEAKRAVRVAQRIHKTVRQRLNPEH